MHDLQAADEKHLPGFFGHYQHLEDKNVFCLKKDTQHYQDQKPLVGLCATHKGDNKLIWGYMSFLPIREKFLAAPPGHLKN